MMGGGNIGKNSYESRASSSSSKFNGVVRVLECWCVGSELRLIKFVIVIICLFEVFNMILYYSRRV